MNLQDVSHIHIPDGDVRMIHDSDNRLLWGAVGYNVLFSGDTFQQTYTGKNLLKLNDGTTTLGGVPITTTNGTVNLKGTATSSAQGYYVTIGMTASEPMVFSPNKSGTTSGLDIKLQYKRGETVYYPSVGNYLSLQAGDIIQQMYLIISNGSVLDGSISPMLEVGSTATSFEPYVGGQPSPNPDYPQQIQTVIGEQTVEIQGKNLLRYPYTGGTVGTGLTWTVADDGTIHVVGTVGGGNKSYFLYNRSQSDFDMPEIPAGTYKVFWSITGSGSSPRITIQDENGYHNSNTSNEVTIATSAKPSNIYIQFTGSQSGDVDLYIKPMIIPSDQADVYEPYISTTYTIDLGDIKLCKFGTYQDYIWKDGSDWKVHKETNTKVYDGTNQGFNYRVGTGVSGKYRFQLDGSVEERSIAKTSSGSYFDGLCNELQAGSRNMTFSALGGNVIAPVTESGYGHIGVVYAAAISEMTLSEANAWLATHNMIVTYALATPTDTIITDTTLITQLEVIYNLVRRYGYNFVVSASGDNLPIIIDRTLL